MDDLRKKQLEMLQMLKIIDKICKENDIKYSLSYGTALGAVRHKGFIPWDDDADISMTYENYKKFEKIWEKNENKGTYFLQNYSNDKKYPMLYAKLRSKKMDAKEKIFEDLGIEEGVWVDIFPVINVSEGKIKKSVK